MLLTPGLEPQAGFTDVSDVNPHAGLGATHAEIESSPLPGLQARMLRSHWLVYAGCANLRNRGRRLSRVPEGLSTLPGGRQEAQPSRLTCHAAGHCQRAGGTPGTALRTTRAPEQAHGLIDCSGSSSTCTFSRPLIRGQNTQARELRRFSPPLTPL